MTPRPTEPTPAPLSDEALLRELDRVSAFFRVLDCGAHYCRYCPAKSPEWLHTPGCPYEQSYQDRDDGLSAIAQAKALITRLLDEVEASRGELASIDAVLARRPALDLPTRRENIERAIGVASRADKLHMELQALLYAVERKHPGETRYETALRYIRQAETSQDRAAKVAAAPPAGGKE